MRQLDQMTAKVWLLARSAGINGRKPRSPMFFKKLGPRHHSRLLFRIQDRARGITIVYWVQRKGYWNMTRVMEAVAGRYPADAPTLDTSGEDFHLSDQVRSQAHGFFATLRMTCERSFAEK